MPHLFLSIKKSLFLFCCALVVLLSVPKTAHAMGEFITTWRTTLPGESITIPTSGGGYNYDVDWGDASSTTGLSGDASHVYTLAGTYTVMITGTFPQIYFDNGGDKAKIRSVEQWGVIAWRSMDAAFYGANNLVINAVDAPDLSSVTEMGRMFQGATSLNQNMSSWDVSNVTSMGALFYGASSFNQPLNAWNVSHVTTMNSMFAGASSFNRPLNLWDTSRVTDMYGVFINASAFNQPLITWITASATDMGNMFYHASLFNQSLSSWDVSHVTSMSGMFNAAGLFNQPLNGWNVASTTDMSLMFYGTTFNQPLSSWDVSRVTSMSGMFAAAGAFNQPLNSWNVSSTTDMGNMFNGATVFNQPLNSWNVSSVTTMISMFQGAAAFNRPLNSWNVSHVTNMISMFANALAFNQSLADWNTSSVTSLGGMFYNAPIFNQSLNSWDVSHVADFNNVFAGDLAFDQPLNLWNVSNATDMTSMLNGATLSTVNYNATLIAWSTLSLQSSVTFDGGNSVYTTSSAARASMISAHGWTITDGGPGPTHTLTYVTDGYGSISGSSTQMLFDGMDGSVVVAVPNSGYSFDSWSDHATTNPRMEAPITGDLVVTARFALIPITQAGGGGSGMGSVFVQPMTLFQDTGTRTKLSVLVNGSDESRVQTNQNTLQLRFNANPGTVKGYTVSLRPDFAQGSIYPYVPMISYTLPSAPGDYTIYTKFFSTTGDPSDVIARSVSYANEASIEPIRQSPSSTSATSLKKAFVFAKSLHRGMKSEDIRQLQVFLNTHGFVIARQGVGSPGNEVPFFGEKTVAALARYQKAKNIKPASGFFGPMTIKILNAE